MSLKKVALSLGVTAAISVTAFSFYNFKLINAYYKDFKYNPFKKGDKVYAYRPFAAMSTSKLFLMRIAKSKNDSQYFVLMPAAFTNDSLYKYKSSYIGKYIKRTIFPIQYNDSTLYATLYAIEPLKRALITQATKGDTLPAGYEYIDDNLYGLPNSFEPKESTKFYDFR